VLPQAADHSEEELPKFLPFDRDPVAGDQVPAEVLRPGVEVAPVVSHPTGSTRGGKKDDRGCKA
jgi:hypothetical protein